jgi:cell division protein FtsI/penicillin-binding protein 2
MTEKGALRAHKRARFVVVLLLLCFVCCLFRIGWMQLVIGEELTARAEENQSILRELESPRGAIYDREGRELAVSLISLSLFADPLGMEDPKDAPPRDVRRLAAKLLSGELGRSEEELYGIFSEGRHFAWLERTIDKSRTDRLETIIRENSLPGLGFLKESKRYYPMGDLAAQVLGFVGTDDKGLAGIENTLDSVLKSAVEPQLVETDHAGRPIFSSVFLSNKARKMSAVYLTLDNRVQYAAEKALSEAVARTGAKGAAALVMDVHTGEILAMANFPAFDPNYFDSYSESSWVNRCVATVYEPGSTFKPLIAAMALNEGIVRPESVLYDAGKINVDDRVIQNAEENGARYVTFDDAITRSINTIMVEVGLELGKQRMNKYARAFGLGSYTDVSLPGESAGLLFQTDDMRPIDVATMSIGQGIAVTPLQLVCALAALANDGVPPRPAIIKKILRPDGQEKSIPRQKSEQVVTDPQFCRETLEMMEHVVSRGSGALAQIPGYKVAGKTGTAEKMQAGGGYAPGEYIASFVGIAPVEEPRFIALVLVDTPHSMYYGSQVAAPAFREIMQQTLVIYGVEPSRGKNALPIDKGARAAAAPLTGSLQGASSVPDLKGYSMREAARILEQNGLSLYPEGSGKAVRQAPLPFTAAQNGSTVKVWFE